MAVLTFDDRTSELPLIESEEINIDWSSDDKEETTDLTSKASNGA